ncbi:flagellar biosynthesis protein FlhB [Kushneria phosphatilytica]|uniref:Flagellar biosynthetic protein FlhB n=1 Tax=Kushneria phosphatilytica TaxID=657387 RepID=A0A1S1NVP2_9GAMM|nr:flagellar biosynthesis protein FlhB [Kushneria phosphatilytica]OHV12031.1 flagellar biosynthesis protein FlhB [Kushneria phosphatilytica]QEL11224.1 flagellar type III secretion system protein FlhB [Kushneria phosphatilytica]
MANDSDQEKTEQPTPRRLEKAREEGQVARSRELTTFALISVGIGTLWLMAGWMGSMLADVMRGSMSFAHDELFDDSRMLIDSFNLGVHALLALAPLLGVLAVIAFVSPMLLGGWLFSTKSLKPDPNKLNPVSGLKRIFSSQALAELAKTIAKSILIGVVAAMYLYFHQEQLVALAGQSILAAMRSSLTMAATCCALIMLAFIGVILLDVPYQIWSHHKKLRMSREDIRQEHKESEGDPQVKGRIRQQQQAMARRRMMSEVPQADVIVTNPTHFAVALAYREEEMGAPRVVAKGADAVAARIREVGREHHVPLLEAPPLARALYRHADLEREIPGPLYTAVAEVLAWVYQLRRFQSEGGPAPNTPQDIAVPPELDSTAGDEPATHA